MLARLHVDQLGSLVRPDGLRNVFHRHALGEATDMELRAAQDSAIEAVVREQEQLGLPVIGDGEFRRRDFTDSYAEVSGFDERPLQRRMELTANRPLEEYQFAQGLTERPVKTTLLSADRVWQLCASRESRRVYPDDEALLADVIAVQRQIIAGLVEAGCTYLQIDGPGYAAYTDPSWIAFLRGRGLDPITALMRSAAADRAAIEGFTGVTFGIHLCHGDLDRDRHGEWTYDGTAEALFDSLPHARFLLECDRESLSFEALRFVPKDKVVVLGLISTTTAELEHEDDLLRRIEAAAKHIDIEQLGLSPQCGFASDIGRSRCTADEQWRKLELMLRVADKVWSGERVDVTLDRAVDRSGLLDQA